MKHNKKPVSRYLHQFSGYFSSITNLKVLLLEELGEELSYSIKFDAGYFETRTAKCLLATNEDLRLMYEKLKGVEINLWCSANDAASGASSTGSKTRKRRRDSDDEDSVDTIYQDLKDKHGEKYSIPQLRLWARMIHCSTHDNYDKPPAVPMFSDTLQPKRQKKESLTETIVAISKALNSPSQNSNQSNDSSNYPLGLSPRKSVDLRMKNLEQLHYIKQLYEDNILTDKEFIEQKQTIIDSLRKLK